MTRWRKGEAEASGLIEQRHLQRVTADPEIEEALLSSAARHVESARQTADSDPEAACSLAYDAARKSAAAVLAHQGLRTTCAGGHLAVIHVIRAQFPGVPGMTSIDRIRRRRNQAEYPDPKGYDPITAAEAKEAIEALTVLKSGKATYTLTASKLRAGTYKLTAAYGGSADYSGSASPSRTLTVADWPGWAFPAK